MGLTSCLGDVDRLLELRSAYVGRHSQRLLYASWGINRLGGKRQDQLDWVEKSEFTIENSNTNAGGDRLLFVEWLSDIIPTFHPAPCGTSACLHRETFLNPCLFFLVLRYCGETQMALFAASEALRDLDSTQNQADQRLEPYLEDGAAS